MPATICSSSLVVCPSLLLVSLGAGVGAGRTLAARGSGGLDSLPPQPKTEHPMRMHAHGARARRPMYRRTDLGRTYITFRGCGTVPDKRIHRRARGSRPPGPWI